MGLVCIITLTSISMLPIYSALVGGYFNSNLVILYKVKVVIILGGFYAEGA